MIFPPLPARVEQFGDGAGFRVDAGEVCAFVEVAVDARQAEVFLMIGTAVLARAMGSMCSVASGESSWRKRQCSHRSRARWHPRARIASVTGPRPPPQDGDELVGLHLTRVLLTLFLDLSPSLSNLPWLLSQL